jgi:uncharacterized protein (TIGR00297 family)
MSLAAGLAAATAIAVLSYRARALTASGAAAAAIVGALIFAAGGLPWAAVLLFFFVSGSLLSRMSRIETATAVVERGYRRDWRQVAANGGVQTVAAAAFLAHPSPVWPLVFAAATAAATADTWATELGRRSGRPPRLITSGAVVAPGISGGVTSLGIAASALGALAVGVLAFLLGLGNGSLVPIATLAGLTGSVADSYLGATIQERRFCPACGLATEQRVHRLCGSTTVRDSGIPGIDNDAVNLLAIVAASAAAVVLSRVVF